MLVKRDAGLGSLLRGDARRICGDFQFTEGPVWVATDECLLFTDIPNQRIHRWRPGQDGAEVYREDSGHANGLTLDNNGNLLTCEHSGRRVSVAAYGGAELHAIDSLEGQRFNSPNDVVVDTSGVIWFTDPTYGLTNPRLGDPTAQRDLDFQGVYRVATDGAIRCVTREFSQPNGLVFTPDESHLYIGDSQDKIIRRYRVEADGTLSGGDLFVDMRDAEGPGAPDGMAVDETGRLWTTGTGGVWVVEADGTIIGVLELPENPANLCFGGPDWSTLYLTARTSVYAIETAVRGVAPGSR